MDGRAQEQLLELLHIDGSAGGAGGGRCEVGGCANQVDAVTVDVRCFNYLGTPSNQGFTLAFNS